MRLVSRGYLDHRQTTDGADMNNEKVAQPIERGRSFWAPAVMLGLTSACIKGLANSILRIFEIS